MESILDNNYPDVNQSLVLSSSPQVLNQNYVYSQITSNTSTSGYNPKNPYQINFPSVLTTNQVDLNSPLEIQST